MLLPPMTKRCWLCLAVCLCFHLYALADTPQVRILFQDSPLAGSQFHGLETVFDQLQLGDVLTLHREPENRHDPKAIRVEWRGVFLGYVPRRENKGVAQALDEGLTLDARITRLQADPDPWQRLRFSIFVRL